MMSSAAGDFYTTDMSRSHTDVKGEASVAALTLTLDELMSGLAEGLGR